MNNRKKILFILGVLDSGGVAKSLVSLINAIDRTRCDVSLLLVASHKGQFFELLPQDVTILQDEVLSNVGTLEGLSFLLKKGYFCLALGTILRLALACVSKAWSGYVLSRLMPPVKGEYDLIVDYNGQHQTYYMVDKLKAKKKVAFFHSDYAKWPYYYKMDRRYYPKLDAIFTVSPMCVQSLKKYFPEQADKIQLMENISSLSVIEKMAEDDVILPQKAKWTFLTVGHVCINKGTDLAIRAGKILKDKGIDFLWCFVGSTEEQRRFESLLNECGVQSNFAFLGIKTNPYPYFKHCDIVVHPSLFEGKSVTLDEAKLLCKPIVVTNFSTVSDQFEDGVNANVVEMAPQALAEGILDLINDSEKRNRYKNWLDAHKRDNASEVEKLYKLME